MFKFFRIGNTELLTRVHDIELNIKDIKHELEKIDIKAMEAQRSYRAKLKRLTGDEKEESETNKNNQGFLSPNGTPI
jgi:hypothetical protein